jgi:hypothetical protein
MDTLLIIEVHYAKIILEELHYDSIYHEHLCYFSLQSLKNLLDLYGIHLYHLEKSPISGGSIVCLARLTQLQESSSLLQYVEQEEQCQTNSLESWKKFSENAHKHKDLFIDLLNNEVKNGKRIVGYGASARSSTMLNFCNITKNQIQLIADQNPMKHDLLTPGTNIPIQSPETVFSSHPDIVVILAWNFLEEICQYLYHTLHFDGKIFIPLPYPPKLLAIREVIHE